MLIKPFLIVLIVMLMCCTSHNFVKRTIEIMFLLSPTGANPGNTWWYLVMPGNTWQYLTIPLQYLPIPNNTLVLVGIAWYQKYILYCCQYLLPVSWWYHHETVQTVFLSPWYRFWQISEDLQCLVECFTIVLPDHNQWEIDLVKQ